MVRTSPKCYRVGVYQLEYIPGARENRRAIRTEI
jgi:hypothetical protein